MEKLATPFKSSNTPVSDPDYHVHKLKSNYHKIFENLIFSYLTKHLDIESHESISGMFDPNNPKRAQSDKKHASKIWAAFSSSSSKKKETREEGLQVTEKLVTQIGQLSSFLIQNLHVEGLFRQPGSKSREQALMEVLKTDLVAIDFKNSCFNPLDAASVLKTYLKMLDEPLLIPSKYFDAHVQIAKMNKIGENGEKIVDKIKRTECLQLLMFLLPPSYRNLLKGILDLLYKTAKHQDKNKMSASNLSAMLTPHLIWPRHMKAADIKDYSALLNDHVAFIIRRSQHLFRAPEYIRITARVILKEKKGASASENELSPSVYAMAPSSAVKQKLDFRTVEAKTKEEVKDMVKAEIENNPNSNSTKKVLKKFGKHDKVKNTPEGKRTKSLHKRSKSGINLLRKKIKFNDDSKVLTTSQPDLANQST